MESFTTESVLPLSKFLFLFFNFRRLGTWFQVHAFRSLYTNLLIFQDLTDFYSDVSEGIEMEHWSTMG